MIISSQRYLNDEFVQVKRDARDYVVTVSPEFEIDGVTMQVVIDGLHSLAAALLDGVEPVFEEVTVQEDDRIALLDSSVDDYLEANYIEYDWYDIATGERVF